MGGKSMHNMNNLYCRIYYRQWDVFKEVFHEFNRIFKLTAIVLSLLAAVMIVLSPTLTISAPSEQEAPVKIIEVENSLYRTGTSLTVTDKANYKKNIEYFADAVYEASEGANKIGKETIYTDGQCALNSDIVWVQNCHPSASVSGRLVEGKNVNFCDIFPDPDPTLLDYTFYFLTNDTGHQRGGYTLGHEWGHYYTSMWDEYAAANTP
jgi:hypothetical protein